jgi:hypothetical protein
MFYNGVVWYNPPKPYELTESLLRDGTYGVDTSPSGATATTGSGSD